MPHISKTSEEDIIQKRDAKARPHLEQYAPVWIVDEHFFVAEEAVQFNVVFLHPHATQDGKPAWVNRRYRYDGFNDTLYHKGQRILDEEDVLDLMEEQEPYIDAIASDVPNSYGG